MRYNGSIIWIRLSPIDLLGTHKRRSMNFYSRYIFPRLCNVLLNSPLVAQRRRETLASAHGDVLEIGFGTGLNLPCYPEPVRKLTTVDPNPGMNSLARKKVNQTGKNVASFPTKLFWLANGGLSCP